MLRALTLLLTVLGLLAPPAAAQGNEARATLYTRVVGETVYASAVVRISFDWYLYHTDLGDPDAIGTPLSLRFGESNEGWSEPVLPAPHVKHVDDAILGTYSYNYHEGKLVLFATGDLAAGASEDDPLTLVGLTCSNVTGLCIPYQETVASKGEGKAKYWEDWPESLGALPAADPGLPVEMPGGEPPEEGDEGTGSVGPPVLTQPGQEGQPSIIPSFGGQSGPGDQKVDARLYVRIDEDTNQAKLVVVIDLAEGHYIYNGPEKSDLGHPDFTFGNPTTVEVLDDSYAIEWRGVAYPKPTRKDGDEFSPWYWQHKGRVVLRVNGKILDDPEGSEPAVILGYQVCDANTCDPPTTVELYSEGPGEDEWFETASYKGEDAPEDSLLLFLLKAIGWGLFTLLMPCTYPMIPITISFFTKQAEARGGRVLPLSIAYGLGIVAVFVLIGLIFAPVIIPFATHWVTNLVIGTLFLFFAFVLFGMVNLQPPAALMNLAGKASATGGYLGVFLMGATLVVTSFTCTAPFVGTLLGSAAVGGDSDVLRIVLGMAVFGLTMATPFVFLSLVPGRIQQMPQAGEWMNTLKVFLGFVELAAALKFISNADVVLKWGVVSRELFLAVWLLVFAAAGAYLIKKALQARAAGGPAGSNQIRFGALSILFGLYCGYGIPGNKLDGQIMTPLLPPYAWVWDPYAPKHEVVKDDWERALELAREESKLVLVNFTGFT